MTINQYVNLVFSGVLFHDCLYDESQDFEKPYFNFGYPWAMVYFRIDTETIIAFGVQRPSQSPSGLLKKVKDNYFEVDFTIKPKTIKTVFGPKKAYYAKKIELSQNKSKILDFSRLN